MKIKTYPGTKSKNGNPNIVRTIILDENNKIGSKIMAHAIHKMISIGYLINDIFILHL